MPKQNAKKNAESKSKSPAKLNPLAEYLIDESVREGEGPDAAMQAQIDLLNSGPEAEDENSADEPQEKAPKKTAPGAKRGKTPKAAKTRGKKKR